MYSRNLLLLAIAALNYIANPYFFVKVQCCLERSYMPVYTDEALKRLWDV